MLKWALGVQARLQVRAQAACPGREIDARRLRIGGLRGFEIQAQRQRGTAAELRAAAPLQWTDREAQSFAAQRHALRRAHMHPATRVAHGVGFETRQDQRGDARGVDFNLDGQAQMDRQLRCRGARRQLHAHALGRGLRRVDAQPALRAAGRQAQCGGAQRVDDDAVLARRTPGNDDAIGTEAVEQAALEVARVDEILMRQRPRQAALRAQSPAQRAEHGDGQDDDDERADEPAQQAEAETAPCAGAWRVGWAGLRGHAGNALYSAMPTLKCRRALRTSTPYAQSMRSGPTGLRQRRPRP